MYVLEGIGKEEFVKRFKTKENAEKGLEKFVRKFERDYDVSEEFADVYELWEDKYEYANRESYQACLIYKEPTNLQEELLLEIDRADLGLTQYSFELMDSWTCRAHLDNLKEMIKKM